MGNRMEEGREAGNRERLLYLLKTGGPQTAARLAAQLALTSMGVRKHLLALEQEGRVCFEDRAQAVGRPARFWALTPRAHARFGDRHADLALQLVRQVQTLFGEEGLAAVLSLREKETRARYLAAMDGVPDPDARVAALGALRERDGYMVTLERDDAGWLLHENHCPITAAAESCQRLCAMELVLFRQVLGADFTVERAAHAVAGDRCCSYRIRRA